MDLFFSRTRIIIIIAQSNTTAITSSENLIGFPTIIFHIICRRETPASARPGAQTHSAAYYATSSGHSRSITVSKFAYLLVPFEIDEIL